MGDYGSFLVVYKVTTSFSWNFGVRPIGTVHNGHLRVRLFTTYGHLVEETWSGLKNWKV